MSVELNFFAESDPDGGGIELTVGLKARDFAGRGSAWFTAAQLLQFAAELARYPLSSANPALTGGFWNREASQVVQEHVHLDARAYGNLGAIKLLIRVAVPEDSADLTTNPRYSASGAIQTDYATLLQLSEGIRDIANGTRSELFFSFPD
jgi:hypothetical protein